MSGLPGNIVVTGGSGRLGQAICRLARRCSMNVRPVDIEPAPQVEYADIRDFDRLASLFEGADCVIHCAGLHAPHVGRMPDRAFRQINIEGTATVIRAVRRAQVPSLVFTSTTALLGGGAAPGQPARWIDETVTPSARTIYHETKIEAEALVRSATAPALKASILRLGRCFPEPPDVMAIHRLSRGIDIRDAATAHLRAAMSTTLAAEPEIVSAPTPFERDDCSALGKTADQVIRKRCPDLAAAFDDLGWTLPLSIDRIYDSSRARDAWNWHPRHDARSVFRQFTP